jgi:colanic acid/amylovoran biosynthesis glycosyltransferase
MRIAFLLHQFPALSETFILRQITGLIELGHDVRIFAEYPCENGASHPAVSAHNLLERTTYLDSPAESGRYELPAWPAWGVTWSPDTGERLSNARRLMRSVPKALTCFAANPRLTREVLTTRHYGYQAKSLSALYRLSALAEQEQSFDVLHAHFGPVGQSFRFARRLWGAPLVVSFHGYDFSTWPKREGTKAYCSLFQEVDLVTVHTDFAERRLRDLGCPARLLRRLECGIDLAEFTFRPRQAPADRPVRLLTVARIVEKKGIEFSIRAVAHLLREGYRLQYEVIGDGPLRESLMKLTGELGAQRAVTFVGARDGSYVRQQMGQSDLFVLASVTAADGDTEGAPVSLLEAQACGIPVVATRHAGIPEIVADGKSGLLAPERDVLALVGALRHVLDNPGLWPSMGRHGREYVERRHDLSSLNRQLVELYHEAGASEG